MVGLVTIRSSEKAGEGQTIRLAKGDTYILLSKPDIELIRRVELSMTLHVTATRCHLPYGITQCYLPPDTSELTPP